MRSSEPSFGASQALLDALDVSAEPVGELDQFRKRDLGAVLVRASDAIGEHAEQRGVRVGGELRRYRCSVLASVFVGVAAHRSQHGAASIEALDLLAAHGDE